MRLTRAPRLRRRETGAVAILAAVSMTALLVVVAMVLDFGLVRVDRQKVKSLADSTAMSGIVAGDAGTGEVYTYRAVCGALSYLKSHDAFAALPADMCTSASLTANSSVRCTGTASTHVAYDHELVSGPVTYRVIIKSPYVLSEGSWSEESMSTLSGDQSTMDGCDQVGVIITQKRKPGLGSIATDGDLAFAMRSASRALVSGQDSLAPALILLERTACSALTVGSAGGGSGTYIQVHGSGATPGSIHLDSVASGADCGSGSNQQLIQGKQNDGVVAYGSVSPAGTAGVITSAAVRKGVAANIVYDNLNQVYGTTSTSGTGASKIAVSGRDAVGRMPVDKRYRASVRTAISSASSVWGSSAGWTVAGCNPGAAALAVTTKLWIDCTGSSGITLNDKTIQASEVYFNGFVKNGKVAMPNATRVYVSNTASGGAAISSAALSLGNTNGFCIRSTCGTATTDKCSTTSTTNRARLFIRQGNIDATGGTLRLCNTTAFLLGGNTTTGCVPSTDGPEPVGNPPTTIPCGTAGNSTLSVTGGATFDWTAPNEYATGIPTANQPTAYGNFEDLALWSESAGSYKFSGGGGMNTVGVYMVPNGSPVNVGGGSSQTLTNAQYVARTFSVTGGGTLSLTTDPKNAVTIPTINGYVLVR